MKLTFYNKNLQKKEVVFTWLSLFWQSKYNDVGTFTAEFQKDLDLWGKIQVLDFVVYNKVPNDIMVVWAIEVKNNKVVISGRSALSLLDNRVSVERIRNQNAEAAMRGIISDMREWGGISLGELKNIPEKFTAQISGDSVLNYLITISQYCDIGIRLLKSGASLLFDCYKPPLNGSVKYSAKFGNMNDEQYAENELNYRNVAYVHGQGEGESRVIVEVGDTEAVGSARREMYIDARDIQQEEEETFEEYKERLKERGLEKLAEQYKVVNTSFSLTDTENINLGDLVTLTPTYLNMAYQARVVEMIIKSQNNQTKRTISIGTLMPIRRSI